MCRLLGIVSNEHTDFRLCLREAPRSLALLSRQHPHGWGIAVYESGQGWTVQKRMECAHLDERFHEVAVGSTGEVLVAHIRKRTVGPVTLSNTHPFQRGRWVFAHNGTIADLGFLREGTSSARLAQIEGQTDSELLFAYLLTQLDAAGVGEGPADERTDAVLLRVRERALSRPSFGACNYLLSDGDTLYAQRHGRTLYLLERVPGDRVLVERRSHETGAVLEMPWSPRRHAVLIASESITDEPWRPIAEGMLIRVDRRPALGWSELRTTST